MESKGNTKSQDEKITQCIICRNNMFIKTTDGICCERCRSKLFPDKCPVCDGVFDVQFNGWECFKCHKKVCNNCGEYDGGSFDNPRDAYLCGKCTDLKREQLDQIQVPSSPCLSDYNY